MMCHERLDRFVDKKHLQLGKELWSHLGSLFQMYGMFFLDTSDDAQPRIPVKINGFWVLKTEFEVPNLWKCES